MRKVYRPCTRASHWFIYSKYWNATTSHFLIRQCSLGGSDTHCRNWCNHAPLLQRAVVRVCKTFPKFTFLPSGWHWVALLVMEVGSSTLTAQDFCLDPRVFTLYGFCSDWQGLTHHFDGCWRTIITHLCVWQVTLTADTAETFWLPKPGKFSLGSGAQDQSVPCSLHVPKIKRF